MRDAKSYCAILYQDNNRKPICRLYFNNPQRKQVGLFDGEQEEKVTLSEIPELYSFSDRLRAVVVKYREPLKSAEEA